MADVAWIRNKNKNFIFNNGVIAMSRCHEWSSSGSKICRQTCTVYITTQGFIVIRIYSVFSILLSFFGVLFHPTLLACTQL